MKFSGKRGLALILIAVGGLVLLDELMPFLAGIAGLLFPLAILLLGIYGVKQGRYWIGGILAVIGSIALMAQLSGWMGWIIALVLIGFGIQMLKHKRAY